MSEEFLRAVSDNLFANTSNQELSVERVHEVAHDIASHLLEAAKKELMKKAKVGIVVDNYVKFKHGFCIDLDPAMQLKPAFNVKEGDKVKVLVVKEE